MTASLLYLIFLNPPNRRKRDQQVRPETEGLRQADRHHSRCSGVHKTSTCDVIAITVKKIATPYTEGVTNDHGIVEEERTC
jgi:hypothetical protein